MVITTLIENTSRDGCLKKELGLSFYVETANHKILFDTGASGAIVENAAVLGVDLSAVDVVVLSHGHYDHGGGLEAFFKVNGKAVVYVQESAFGDYYSRRGEDSVYIGLDKTLANHSQIIFVDGNLLLDEELFLFSGVVGRKLVSEANGNLLYRRNGEYVLDAFAHEQYLVVKEKGKDVLFSGCAHCGIVNILDRYAELAGGVPDCVFGGFHLSNPRMEGQVDDVLLEALALRLLSGTTAYYTCHCTGLKSFEILRLLMGARIRYVGVGDRIEVE